MSAEKMREAFLIWWWHEDRLQLRQSCAEGWGIYIWSASRAAIEVELPDYTSPFYGGDHFDECQYAADCEKAIESLGLKVKQ